MFSYNRLYAGVTLSQQLCCDAAYPCCVVLVASCRSANIRRESFVERVSGSEFAIHGCHVDIVLAGRSGCTASEVGRVCC